MDFHYKRSFLYIYVVLKFTSVVLKLWKSAFVVLVWFLGKKINYLEGLGKKLWAFNYCFLSSRYHFWSFSKWSDCHFENMILGHFIFPYKKLCVHFELICFVIQEGRLNRFEWTVTCKSSEINFCAMTRTSESSRFQCRCLLASGVYAVKFVVHTIVPVH